MEWRWKYFTAEEVLSPQSYDIYQAKGLLLIQPALLDKLSELREKLNKPLLINHAELKLRGFRTFEENRTIEKSGHYSQHQYGLAADVTVRDLTVKELAQAAEQIGFRGVGIYPASHFVHMDLRTNLKVKVTRWQGS